jgi:hypothetical protein
VTEQVRELLRDLDIRVDVTNQARVHLWYRQYFGSACPPLTSTRGGIDRYLVTCTCVGIEASTGDLYAPYGLQELWSGRLTINPIHKNRPDLFLSKAASYKRRWPLLTIIEPQTR